MFISRTEIVTGAGAGRGRAGLRESDIMPLQESLQIMETLDRAREQLGVTYPGE